MTGAHRPDVAPHGAHDTEGPTIIHLNHSHATEELAGPEMCERCGSTEQVASPTGSIWCAECGTYLD